MTRFQKLDKPYCDLEVYRNGVFRSLMSWDTYQLFCKQVRKAQKGQTPITPWGYFNAKSDRNLFTRIILWSLKRDSIQSQAIGAEIYSTMKGISILWIIDRNRGTLDNNQKATIKSLTRTGGRSYTIHSYDQFLRVFASLKQELYYGSGPQKGSERASKVEGNISFNQV